MKWKLVVFSSSLDDHKYPTTHTTPERTIESYRKIVEDMVDPNNVSSVWADLERVGARYSELSHATLVLISYDE
jgi:hypothetical protein